MTRRGFTLWEMVIVLVVLALSLGVAVPAFVRFGAAADRPLDELLALLRAARRTAIHSGVPVSVVIDPETGRFRVDTLGAGGAGAVDEGTLALAAGRGFDADSARLHFLFRPDGAATADTLRVRADGRRVAVVVDAWSGVARALAR